jgi:5-methylthioadenosine/S-adenosylhomocysteine deaminase
MSETPMSDAKVHDIDLLVRPRWIVPVEPPGVVLENHSLAVKDGRIVALVGDEESAGFRATEVVDLTEHALIPGLVNAHTHSPMSLLRGIADDLPLMEWLEEHIWPAEQAWTGPDFVADGTALALAEMIRGGITCFSDMYFFPDATARVAHAAGIRARVGLVVVEFPSPWARDAEDYLRKGLAVHDVWKNDPLIGTVLAPHAPYTVDDEALKHIQVLADELDIGIQMHVHETAEEIDRSQERFGMRPIARLEKVGLLNSALQAVHMTQLTPGEIAQCAEAGVSVIHCPESNLKLAAGFCPVTKLLTAGVNVALGTDGAASNNDLDMLGEMRTAALLAKGVSGNPASVPAGTALRMATLNGAQALGLGQETGSLEPGKAADMVAIRMDTSSTLPLYNLCSQLVYSTHRGQVSDVWVAGRRLLENAKLTTIDETEVLSRARYWGTRIRQHDAKNANG